MGRRWFAGCLFWSLLAGLIGAGLTGCVRRRMTIRSNPPGALVYVDNYEVGRTPCSADFTYYGTRQVKLVKDGYETLTINQPIPTPWYEIPPLDFFSETVVPGRIRDERLLVYDLRPQVIVPTERLLSRAERLRQAARAPGPIQPVSAVAPSVGETLGSPLPAAPGGASRPREVLPPPPAAAGRSQLSPAGPAASEPRPQSLPPRGIAPIYAPPPLPANPGS